jgi:hypothetical protein
MREPVSTSRIVAHLVLLAALIGFGSIRAQSASPQARKVTEYSRWDAVVPLARVDTFAKVLKSEPTAQGYIVVYGGRRTVKDEAVDEASWVRRRLIRRAAIDSMLIGVIDGGYREWHTVELWLVPKGASPPMAAPTITVREVRGTDRRGRRTRR